MSETKTGPSLTDVRGIGEEYARRLREAGIEMVEDLLETAPEEIARILGITLAKAKKLHQAARELLADYEVLVQTAEEIQKTRAQHVQKITTSSRRLDEILGGGVETDAITTFVGEFASGKTQLCYQLAVNCVNYLNRDVAWIETEPNTFRVERLVEMMRASRFDEEKITATLKRIHVAPASTITDTNKQYAAYVSVMRMIERGTNIGLLVVDSFTAKFRAQCAGREMLSERGSELARHFGLLETMAAKYNIAIVLTGQVMGVPDMSDQIEMRVKFAAPKRPYGGDFYLHSAQTIVYLAHRGKNLYEATVVDSSWLPMRSAQFRITPRGIEDVA